LCENLELKININTRSFQNLYLLQLNPYFRPMSQKILITGANGFLGQHLSAFLHHAGFHVFATSKSAAAPYLQTNQIAFATCDLTNKNDVLHLVEQTKPDVIIHSAARSKPDDCETNQDLCLQDNLETTRHLLRAAMQNHVQQFIYMSTDFVFGHDGPHAETDVPNPINFYGESKLMAEQLVQSSPINSCIVRPVFIYGPRFAGMRNCFVQMITDNLQVGKRLKIVHDQQRTPTYVFDLCKGLQTIIEKNANGIFHLSGKNILSPYQMACMIADEAGLDKSLIESVTADTFVELAKRPVKSGLKIDKAMRELDFNPIDYAEGVRLTLCANNWNTDDTGK
jgi:dTDP-4-dehydrorhamnose reductase